MLNIDGVITLNIDAGIGETATQEANIAVERVLEVEKWRGREKIF